MDCFYQIVICINNLRTACLSLFKLIFNFLFNIVNVLDRNACPCISLIRVGRMRYGGRWVEQMF